MLTRINGPVRLLFKTRLIFPGINGPITASRVLSITFS